MGAPKLMWRFETTAARLSRKRFALASKVSRGHATTLPRANESLSCTLRCSAVFKRTSLWPMYFISQAESTPLLARLMKTHKEFRRRHHRCVNRRAQQLSRVPWGRLDVRDFQVISADA